MDRPAPPQRLPSRLDLDAVTPYGTGSLDRVGWLRLDVNEHAGGAPDFVVEAVREAVTADALATYPVYAAWHEEAAAWYGVQPDQLTCTAGGDEAIKAICETFLVAGKPMVMPVPGFDLFALWAQLYGCPLRGVPFAEGFAFDPQAWFAALDGDIGMAVLTSPNNPTGTLVPHDVIEATLQRLDCAVVVDETYVEFSGTSVAKLVAKHPNLFVLRSFSKVHGLAGLRIGAVLSQAHHIAALRRALPPFNVSRLAIAASRAVMQRPQALADHVAAISATRSGFIAALQGLGIATGPAHANFVVARLGDRASWVVQRLADEGILVRDRSQVHPSLVGWVRIAIGTPPQMARCLAALRKQLAPSPPLDALLFDMDGPLVDVSASYRQAIVDTARHFLRQEGHAAPIIDAVGPERVEVLKRRGGLNNDWDCTHALLAELGCTVDYGEVVAVFQRQYWGAAGEGLIAREPFRVGSALRQAIGTRYASAILTGRPRQEALHTLRLHGAEDLWPAERVVAMEDGPAKPAPDGLLRLAAALQVRPDRCAYIGDSVDDMRAATAAGMLALGVLPVGCGWNDGLCERLAEAGAWAVFASVDEVMTWLQG